MEAGAIRAGFTEFIISPRRYTGVGTITPSISFRASEATLTGDPQDRVPQPFTGTIGPDTVNINLLDGCKIHGVLDVPTIDRTDVSGCITWSVTAA
ncbi:hypothetical protein PHLCEN_2v8454 [Hermanssonia centrifuga]|uniref:Uncharacterized protein n=1 Tax=Hermanssonia centrifuga TaxID=98765 RepID=A0A2R6NTK8_9APHY|nr:hypothetical protein PHLCEN_2v8454 [Hermanssonia centrifuga]